MSEACYHLEMDDESAMLCVVNTTKGLMKVTRCPYGISSMPLIIQRTIENLLRKEKKCVVFLDDILLSGETVKELLENLDIVLAYLEEAG